MWTTRGVEAVVDDLVVAASLGVAVAAMVVVVVAAVDLVSVVEAVVEVVEGATEVERAGESGVATAALLVDCSVEVEDIFLVENGQFKSRTGAANREFGRAWQHGM